MKLEEKLVSLRKAKGLSQMKLAEMMNVSRQAISRWEVGAAVPSTDNLKFLGRLYDVPLEYLLHDDAPEPVHQETEKNSNTGKKRLILILAAIMAAVDGRSIMSYIAMVLLPLITAYFAYELFSYSEMPVICAEITIGLILLYQINKKKG